MILKRKTIDIPELSIIVLEACPSESDINFQKGYITLVDKFFGDMDHIAFFFYTDANGHLDLDVEIFLEFSLREVEHDLNLLPGDQKKSYWAGVSCAVEKSIQALQLAYETEDLKAS